MIDLELDMAKNMFGRLTPDIRKRLERVVKNPTIKNWEDAHTIIIIGADGFMTLWQAVIRVNPSFPRTGRCVDLNGRVLQGWSRIPDKHTLVRALKYATH